MNITAADLMSEQLISVSCDTSVAQAASKLNAHRISGLPVVDADGTLMGMFTQYDVLKTQFCQEMGAKPVSTCMTKGVFTLDASASWIDVIDEFVDRRLRLIPILREGKVVGVISRGDMILRMSALSKNAVSAIRRRQPCAS